MQRSHVSAKANQSPVAIGRQRIHPAVHLQTGDLVGAFVELDMAFDDRPVFSEIAPPPSAARWVTDRLRELRSILTAQNVQERPVILPLPAMALNDPDLPSKCADTLAGTRLCAQEFSFEFTDAAFATCQRDVASTLRAFRQRGFRVSIDARLSCTAELAASNWLMIDTLRIPALSDATDEALLDRVETARTAGVAIVAERPYWRDGDALADLGIEYGLHPRADA